MGDFEHERVIKALLEAETTEAFGLTEDCTEHTELCALCANLCETRSVSVVSASK